MRSTIPSVPAFADDGAIANDDASDQWIGLDGTDAAPGELDGPPHPSSIRI
jgi:hypothetical protein